MSTKKEGGGMATPPMSTPELATALIKHYELHEGRYNLLLEFQIGIGPVGVDLENPIPGAFIGVNKIGLQKAKPNDLAAIDAAVVNPLVKPRKVSAKTLIMRKAK